MLPQNSSWVCREGGGGVPKARQCRSAGILRGVYERCGASLVSESDFKKRLSPQDCDQLPQGLPAFEPVLFADVGCRAVVHCFRVLETCWHCIFHDDADQNNLWSILSARRERVICQKTPYTSLLLMYRRPCTRENYWKITCTAPSCILREMCQKNPAVLY